MSNTYQPPQPIVPFTVRGVPFPQANVDTDQIIPARFLKGTVKTGLGQNLFYDWRYTEAGESNPNFVLNQPQYRGAEILIGGPNFGCGSSREHAPWALKDYGFKAVFSAYFADIFQNNALKNRLLPITLPESVMDALSKEIAADPTLPITVDLAAQQVVLPKQGVVGFEINPFWKACLLNGVDEVGYTLQFADKIAQHEAALR